MKIFYLNSNYRNTITDYTKVDLKPISRELFSSINELRIRIKELKNNTEKYYFYNYSKFGRKTKELYKTGKPGRTVLRQTHYILQVYDFTKIIEDISSKRIFTYTYDGFKISDLIIQKSQYFIFKSFFIFSYRNNKAGNERLQNLFHNPIDIINTNKSLVKEVKESVAFDDKFDAIVARNYINNILINDKTEQYFNDIINKIKNKTLELQSELILTKIEFLDNTTINNNIINKLIDLKFKIRETTTQIIINW